MRARQAATGTALATSTSKAALYNPAGSFYVGGMSGAVFVLLVLPLLIVATSLVVYRVSRERKARD